MSHKSILLFVLTGIVTSAAFLFLNESDQPSEGEKLFHQEIAFDKVEKVRAGIVDDNVMPLDFRDIVLNQQQIKQALELLNSTPENRVREVQSYGDVSIIAGVVFELKDNSNVRVQYDKEDIYITWQEKTGQTKYVADYPELEVFFDANLK